MAGTPQKAGSAGKTSSPRQEPSQIEVWTGYTHYLLAADGLLRLTDALCKKKLDEARFAKVSGVIAATHVALKAMNEQLLKGIEKMKEGEAPDFSFDPSPIPDWPADSGETSVFSGAWEAMKAVLEKMLEATDSSGVMGAAIAAVISSGDEIIKSLEPAFG